MCIRDRDKLVDNLKVFITAAKQRGDALDHVLLHGPPGLGTVSYTHLRAHETVLDLVCRLLLEKKNDSHYYKALRSKIHIKQQIK